VEGAIRISRAAFDDIAAHARQALPVECCGVLIGKAATILEARRTANLADDPNRFLVDPKGHIDARRDARNRGLDVVGFYHSHPHSEPVPSPTDLAEMAYPDCLYLIVRPLADTMKCGLFRVESSMFVEVELQVVERLG
jgi:proteasome lid subunit RPN8/RPN11